MHGTSQGPFATRAIDPLSAAATRLIRWCTGDSIAVAHPSLEVSETAKTLMLAPMCWSCRFTAIVATRLGSRTGAVSIHNGEQLFLLKHSRILSRQAGPSLPMRCRDLRGIRNIGFAVRCCSGGAPSGIMSP